MDSSSVTGRLIIILIASSFFDKNDRLQMGRYPFNGWSKGRSKPHEWISSYNITILGGAPSYNQLQLLGHKVSDVIRKSLTKEG